MAFTTSSKTMFRDSSVLYRYMKHGSTIVEFAQELWEELERRYPQGGPLTLRLDLCVKTNETEKYRIYYYEVTWDTTDKLSGFGL